MRRVLGWVVLLGVAGTMLGGSLPTASADPSVNVIVGTNRRDVLVGTSGRDAIFGLRRGDRIFGGGQRDQLFGNAGRDVLFGVDGKPDLIVGGSGFDRCYGDSRDTFSGCERVVIVSVHP